MGASRKAVIFTESRRTQTWLRTYLEANGYQDEVLTFNGTNKDDLSGHIYKEWLEKKKRKLREKIFDTEDQIMEKNKLVDALSRRMKQKTKIATLFTIRWRVE
jgi:hypothetical protein